MTKKINTLMQAKKWALKKKLVGPQAFLRFVMFNFVEKLSETSNDFVFKGGNLLYMKGKRFFQLQLKILLRINYPPVIVLLQVILE